jgi:hypothetical protein
MMQTSISDLIDYLQSERVPTQNLTYSGGSNSVGRTIGGPPHQIYTQKAKLQ